MGICGSAPVESIPQTGNATPAPAEVGKQVPTPMSPAASDPAISPRPMPVIASQSKQLPAGGIANASNGKLQVPVRRLQDYYSLGELLGKGGFGEVRVGIRKSDNKRVAIKMISRLKYSTEIDHENMVTEVDLMLRVRGHPNVVELYDYFEDKSAFWIVCELCNGGELMDRIIKMNHFSEKVASRYFKQMLSGLQHCHKNGVVHRDLKPENFLLESSKEDAQIKITDFGLSCHVDGADTVITEACGSAYYIAPEIFTRKYTAIVDAWALGIILFLLLSGTVPFGASAESENEVYRSIQRDPLVMGKQWNSISAAGRELVTGLLEKDPFKRYTIDQALAHPWVTGDAAMDTPLDRSLVDSMCNFNIRNKFKKEALKLVASTLAAADVQNLRSAFHKIDADNTGFITFTEMTDALKELGMERGTVQTLMRNLDTDGDGRISWPEFLSATAERQMVHQQNNIWWAFCELDRDGDGHITIDEMRAVLKDEPPEMVKKYIDEFDLDKNGVIDYEEFMRMLLPKDLKYRISKLS